MKQNMGTTDRIIRAIVVAPVLLVIAYLVGFATVVGVIATVLAVVMLGTARWASARCTPRSISTPTTATRSTPDREHTPGVCVAPVTGTAEAVPFPHRDRPRRPVP